MQFLETLKAQIARPLLVIWHGLKSHRSVLVRQYLGILARLIQMAFLPPCAPDLNPVEYLWTWLKRHALDNYCPNNLGDLQTTARNQVQKRPEAVQHRCRLLDTGDALVMSFITERSIMVIRHGTPTAQALEFCPAA